MIRGMLKDTSPEAERVQIRLFREASPARRLEITRSLSHWVISASRDALVRLHPDWTEEQIKVAWVRYHYGRGLAEGVARRLGLSEWLNTVKL